MAKIINIPSPQAAAKFVRQAEDKTQLTPAELRALAPAVGDTVVGPDGKEVMVTPANLAAMGVVPEKGRFVSKADGTYYYQDKNGIDILSDAAGYTDGAADDLATIKYSPEAREEWKKQMHQDGNAAQQATLDSHIQFFEDSMGPVPTTSEAAAILSRNLPEGSYSKDDLQKQYDALKAKTTKTDDEKLIFSALGKLLYDQDAFTAVDGIRTGGETDGYLSSTGLGIAATSDLI